MVYFSVTAHITISGEHRDLVTEAFHQAIDRLVTVHRLPVYDSEIISQPVYDVENAEEIRKESNQS